MEIITLDNGLRIFLNPCPELRSAVTGVWVLSGSRQEQSAKGGISHFIEHIVFKGSKSRSGFEIAEGMDEIGATVNAYTTKEYTFFYVKALDYQIIKGSDILFDMLTRPALEEKSIETEKGVILEEIAMCEDDPDDVCYELNESALFEGTSLSCAILGSRQQVCSITAEDIREYMSRRYTGRNIVIGVSGSFDRELMTEKIKEYFDCLPRGDEEGGFYPVPFREGYTLKQLPTEQNHIMLCFPGVGIEHRELYALQLIMFILGTGSSSMLNQRIREELGLVYSVDCWLGRYMGGGYIAVSMSLGERYEEKAITEAVKIISGFCKSVNQRRLDIAKEKLISSLIMASENPQARFSSMGRNLLMLSRFISDDEIIDGIREITLERVIQVSKDFFDFDRHSFTAVGKVKKEEEYRKIIHSAIKGDG